MQFARPREGEAEAVAEWRELFNQRAAAVLDYAGPSCFGRVEGSAIDFVAVPADGAWRWHVQVQRRLSLSDHGCLLFGDAARPVAAARALNPASFRALPQEARADLRRRFALLGHIFGIPPVELHRGPTGEGCPVEGPPEVGFLPRGHPSLLRRNLTGEQGTGVRPPPAFRPLLAAGAPRCLQSSPAGGAPGAGGGPYRRWGAPWRQRRGRRSPSGLRGLLLIGCAP